MELGSYHIVRKLATGGMAEIFLARHQSAEGFQRNLVIKRILPEYSEDESFVRSFLDEAKLAGQLNHPNIVQIYDLGRIGKSYFIAMEYIRGFDLSALLRYCRKHETFLPVPLAVRIFCDVCAGLDYAHNASDIDGQMLGVVHRDVTPSNVIVSLDGPAKVLDFGIAKATAKGDGKTKTGTIKGKFAYLAPEQVLGQPIDRRVDVFATGIMLYELLTNLNPFRGDTEYQSLQNIVSGTINPVHTIRPDCPREFEPIIQKALSRDPAQRFASCAELAAEVEIVGIMGHHSDVHAFLQEREAELTELHERSARGEDSDFSGQIVGNHANVTGVELLGEEMVLRAASEVNAPAKKPLALYALLSLFVVIGIAVVGLLLTRSNGGAAMIAAPEETAIEIVSDPKGASVMINGVLRTGDTPLKITDVAVGKSYKIDVIKKGFRPHTSEVKLEKAGMRTVQLALAQAPEPPRPRAPAPTSGKKEKEREKPEPAAVQESKEPGKLRIVAQPWATVEIDGQKVGDTPFPAREVSAGKHRVTLFNADLNKRVTRTVNVQPGEETVLREDLSKD